MAFDPGLAQRIRDTLGDTLGVTERKMFGGLAFMLHGNMFVGVIESTLMARVGLAQYANALAAKHVREMDFTGRPMKGYVFVGAKGLAEDTDLERWVSACATFVNTLPRKTAK